MSEMVDRVAAAIRGAHIWLDWPEAEECARAAILAMGEPTEDMLESGWLVEAMDWRDPTMRGLASVYSGMIRGALK